MAVKSDSKVDGTKAKSLAFPILIVLLIIAIVAVVVIGYDNMQKTKLMKNPQELGKKELETNIAKLSKHFQVPKDDQPTIATITDKKKLPKVPLFKDAANQDQLFVFPKSGLAILYRPSQDKIVTFSPFNIGPTSTDAANAQPAPQIKIAVFNGSGKTGLTNTVGEKLTTQYNNVVLTEKKDAAKRDYTKTIVVDLTGEQADVANVLANFLGGEVGPLPEGEQAPANTDLLVIAVN